MRRDRIVAQHRMAGLDQVGGAENGEAAEQRERQRDEMIHEGTANRTSSSAAVNRTLSVKQMKRGENAKASMRINVASRSPQVRSACFLDVIGRGSGGASFPLLNQ